VSDWNSKKQEAVTQSSAKAQCVSAATNQQIWPMKFYEMKVEETRSMLFQEKYQGGVWEIDIFLI